MYELKRACHKVYIIRYHLVFIVKYRKDLFLDPTYVSHIKQVLDDISKRYYLLPETIGFDEDHVHILMEAAPKYSPSRVMQIVKSITARELFEQFPELKKQLWGGEFWSDGGFIATVGEGGNADVIRKYILNQGKKGDQLRLINFIEA